MCSLCARNLFLAGRNGERGPRESAARCPYTYCHGIFQVRQPVAEVSRPLLASSHPAHCCRDSLVFGSILHRLDASVRVRCRGASALGTSAKGCQEPAKRGVRLCLADRRGPYSRLSSAGGVAPPRRMSCEYVSSSLLACGRNPLRPASRQSARQSLGKNMVPLSTLENDPIEGAG